MRSRVLHRLVTIKALAGVVSLLLVACSSPPNQAVTAMHSQPPTGMARVVILYPAPVMGSNGMVQVKWNDRETCDIGSGTFFVREIRPGEQKLAFSFCGVRGISRFTLEAKANQSYFLRILPYDSSFRGIVSGYPSEFDKKGVTLALGPLKIEQVNEQEAFSELGTLTPAQH